MQGCPVRHNTSWCTLVHNRDVQGLRDTIELRNNVPNYLVKHAIGTQNMECLIWCIQNSQPASQGRQLRRVRLALHFPDERAYLIKQMSFFHDKVYTMDIVAAAHAILRLTGPESMFLWDNSPLLRGRILLIGATQNVLHNILLPNTRVMEDDIKWLLHVCSHKRMSRALTLIPRENLQISDERLLYYSVFLRDTQMTQLFLSNQRPDESLLELAITDIGSDISVLQVRQLLAAGASPFTLYKRMWTYPVIDDNVWRIINALHQSMCVWTPQRHVIFPPDFRRRIFTLLCLARRACVPREVIYMIISRVAYEEAHDMRMVREELSKLSNRDLYARTIGWVPSSELPERKRRRIIDAVIEVSKGTRYYNPTVVSRLPSELGVLSVTYNGMEMLRITMLRHTPEKPWLTIGSDTACDICLNFVDQVHLRKIAPFHARLAYHNDWMLQVCHTVYFESGEDIIDDLYSWRNLTTTTFSLPQSMLVFTIESAVPTGIDL